MPINCRREIPFTPIILPDVRLALLARLAVHATAIDLKSNKRQLDTFAMLTRKPIIDLAAHRDSLSIMRAMLACHAVVDGHLGTKA